MKINFLVCFSIIAHSVAFVPHASSIIPSRARALYMSAIDDLGIIEEAEERMEKSMESLSKSLGSLRAGRATPDMLNRVFVDYYDVPTPLSQLAGVSVQGSSSLLVDPYDKSCLKLIEKAIIESDIGIMPSNDGEKIRLNVPQMTEEKRKEMSKTAKSLGEDAKVSLRNIRRDTVDSTKKMAKDKDLGISEDNEKDALDSIQKLVDGFVKKVDDIIAKKEKDIMKI